MALLGPAKADNHVSSYKRWLQQFEPPYSASAPAARAYVASLPRKPTISVVMACYDSNIDWLRDAVDSVRQQTYDAWELCVVDDGSSNADVWSTLESVALIDSRIKAKRCHSNGGISAATNEALKLATGEWIAFMDHDDLLSFDALALLADTAVRTESARIIYTDEDKIDENGRRYEPYFKSSWNRELFYSQNMLNHLTAVHRDVIKAAGPLRSEYDGSQDYDLLLRCIEQVAEDAIVHIPFVCYHWRFATQRVNYSQAFGQQTFDNSLKALNSHFERTGQPATAEQAQPEVFYARPRWRLEPKPLVSLIIPTRDRLKLLEPAIRSIRDLTSYPNYEILIADNDSREKETLDYFTQLKRASLARIIPAPGEFNFSRINNIAAREAKGSVIGLINNDIEVINGDWLDEMVSHFARPDVGMVGAKLYYTDGRIQHAGVVTGIGGVAGHVYKYFPGDAPGPFSQLILPRETTGVTAACLLIRKTLYDQVGGLDEANLTVAFNDVDLSLKVRRGGSKIVWTPNARLTHHESVSRGVDTAPEKQRRFQREVQYMISTWGSDFLNSDPYYSPNLTLDGEDASRAWPPRTRRPWDKSPC